MNKIEDFIKRITKAFDKKDAKGMAALFAVPSLIVSEHRIFSFKDQKEIEKEFEQVFKLFKDRGVAHSECAINNLTFLDEMVALLTVEWRLVTEAGTVVWNWNYTYNLLKTKDNWEIVVATPHEQPVPSRK